MKCINWETETKCKRVNIDCEEYQRLLKAFSDTRFLNDECLRVLVINTHHTVWERINKIQKERRVK